MLCGWEGDCGSGVHASDSVVHSPMSSTAKCEGDEHPAHAPLGHGPHFYLYLHKQDWTSITRHILQGAYKFGKMKFPEFSRFSRPAKRLFPENYKEKT